MGRFVSNRGDVENSIRSGNWVVAFSKRELTEEDALNALIATGISVFVDNPGPILAFLGELVDESIAGMEAAIAETLTDEFRNFVTNYVTPIITNFLEHFSAGEQTAQFGNFGVKGGVAQFIGHNEEWNPIAHPENPLGAGAWQQVGPGLVSYCPYVGIRYISNQSPSSVSHINVQFRNETPGTVGFFLNGGGGLTTSLPAGGLQLYNVVVEPGLQPAVTIFQVGGGKLSFTIAQGGHYAFRVDGGKIKNFFDTPSTSANRTMWTGTFQGKSTLFKQVGSSWQEFPDGATSPVFTYTETGSDANFVSLFDASRNMQVALGAGTMFWRTSASGPWAAMYTGGWGAVA